MGKLYLFVVWRQWDLTYQEAAILDLTPPALVMGAGCLSTVFQFYNERSNKSGVLVLGFLDLLLTTVERYQMWRGGSCLGPGPAQAHHEACLHWAPVCPVTAPIFIFTHHD